MRFLQGGKVSVDGSSTDGRFVCQLLDGRAAL